MSGFFTTSGHFALKGRSTIEGRERFPVITGTVEKNKDVDDFLMPDAPTVLGFSRSRDVRDAPSTSNLYQVKTLNYLDSRPDRFVNNNIGCSREQDTSSFHSAPREPRLQSHGMYPFVGENHGTLPMFKKFDLGLASTLSSKTGLPRDNSTMDENCQQSSDLSIINKSSFAMRRNPFESSVLKRLARFNSDIDFRSKPVLPKMFTNARPSNDELNAKSVREKIFHGEVQNLNSTSSSTISFATARQAGKKTNTLSGSDYIWKKFGQKEENLNDVTSFARPSLMQFIKPRATLASTHQEITQTVFKTNVNTSSRINTDNSRRECDTLPDFMLPSTKENQFVSLTLVMTFLENLEHSIISSNSNKSEALIKMYFEQTKKMIARSEASFLGSVRDNDANSVLTSFSSRNAGPLIAESQKKKVADSSLVLKSAQDIIRDLSESSKKMLYPIEEEECLAPQNVRADSHSFDDDKEDSALLFKKPKPSFLLAKKHSKVLTIRTPKSQSNAVVQSTNEIINLRQWYPVATKDDLIFHGVLEDGTNKVTDAVRKRITRRTIELVRGAQCNLIGPPSALITSNFPENMRIKLKDGLTQFWKIFQKELFSHQEHSNNQPFSEKKRKSVRINTKKDNPRKIFGKKVKTPLQSKGGTKQKTGKGSVAAEAKVPPRKMSERDTPLVRGATADGESCTERTGSCTRSGKVFNRFSSSSSEFHSYPVLVENATTLAAMGTPKGIKGKSSSNIGIKNKLVRTSSSPRKSPPSTKMMTRRNATAKGRIVCAEENQVGPPTRNEKSRSKLRRMQAKRKLEAGEDAQSTQRKKSKSNDLEEVNESESRKSGNKTKQNRERKGNDSARSRRAEEKRQPGKAKGKSPKKGAGNSDWNAKGAAEKKSTTFTNDFADGVEELKDIQIPEKDNFRRTVELNRSQLRLVCTETPPLKYFNSNLKLLKNSTPAASPNWDVSQRTESEVKQFQRRRVIAQKKKVVVERAKGRKSTGKTSEARDLRTMFNWIAEKGVRTPTGNSKILRYMIPSRKQMQSMSGEEEEDEEEDKEGGEDDVDGFERQENLFHC